MRVIIIGAGGHAQVVADMLLRANEQGAKATPIGYVDDNPQLIGKKLLGVPVLGSVAALGEIAHEAVIVAIGDNRTRQRLVQVLSQQGESFVTACHPRATVAPDVHIGPGGMICAGAVVNPGTLIGAQVILNTGCTVDHHSHIANYVHIAPGAHLGGEVDIEEGALIGIGAAILPRCRVGAWSVVGGGALVHRDVAEGVTVVGVPAKVQRASIP